MDGFEKLAGRFVLEREIGSGGMARVYVGRDEVLDRAVAVKVLHPGLVGTETAARFRREGSTAARLSHPNIVPVYDAGEDELEGRQTSYIVMEYVPGGDLKGHVQENQRLDASEVCRIGSGAANALSHAHSKGVIHRDVKPHNILLDLSGRPKLTDFGIARALEGTRYTRTGNFLGTALYSAPEQLRGREISGKTDVYALGATLYQVATGEPPFQGTMTEVAEKHLSEVPAPPATDEELAQIILSCLAKDPRNRPSANDLADRLSNLAESGRHALAVAPTSSRGEAAASGASGSGTRGDFGRGRSRTPLAVAALAVVLLLGGAGAYLMYPSGGDPEVAGNVSGGSAGPTDDNSAGGAASGNDAPGVAGGDAGGASVNDDPPETAPEDPVSGGEAPEDTSGPSSGAVRAVRDMYDLAADGDYRGSYGMLTEGFRAEVAPTQAQWSGQFETLESVSFVGEPQVSVSGDTATVSGVTEAVHTDRTERNDSVWTLAREGGEWKLDGLQTRQLA